MKPWLWRSGLKRKDPYLKDKYAYTTSYLLGTTAAAAPIFNHTKELVASITIVGVTLTMNIAKDSILIRGLLKSAREISEQLGYSQ